MSNKIKILIILVFGVTLALIASAVTIRTLLNKDKNIETPEETIVPECPTVGECEFVDCNTKRVYKDNCESEIQTGFCCTNYNSPTDRCEKKDYCSGEGLENLCEEAGQEFNTCDRCSSGKSSKVTVTQGEVGCSYEFEICKVDAECGELVSEEDELIANENSCAEDRDTGEEWKECCVGSNAGKSRIIRKNEDCSFEIVQNCEDDIECVEEENPIEAESPEQGEISEDMPIQTPIDSIDSDSATPTPEPEQQTGSENEPQATSGPQQENDTPVVATSVPNNDLADEPPINDDVAQLPENTVIPIATSVPEEIVPTSTNIPEETIAEDSPLEEILPTATDIAIAENNNPVETPIAENAVISQHVITADQPNMSNNLDNLPVTSIKFQEIAYILLGLVICLFGIVIYRIESVQLKLEEAYIEIRYILFPIKHKGQEERSRKIFERKFKKTLKDNVTN